MDTVMTNQVIQLLQGLKPYLGPKGESAEKLINTLQVVSSPQAQEFMQNLNQLIPKNKFVKKSIPDIPPSIEVSSPASAPVQLNGLFSGHIGIILLLVVVFFFWN